MKPSFVQIADRVGCWWAKLTYDTPLSQVPIIGLKSSLNPLGSFWGKKCALSPRKEDMDKALPMSPIDGPPLPKALGLKWPWIGKLK